MYISKIILSNYRKFGEFTIDLRPGLNILVGASSSGKSTMLEALNLVLNPYLPWYRAEILHEADFHLANTKEPIEIEVWFSCGTHKAPLGPDRKGLCESCFHREASGEASCPFIDRTLFRDLKKEEFLTVEDLAGNEREYDQLVRLKFEAFWDTELLTAKPEWCTLDEDDNAHKLSRDARDWLGFVHIQSARDPSLMLGFRERSLLSRLTSRDILRQIARQVLSEDGWQRQFLEDASLRSVLDYYQQEMSTIMKAESFGVTSRDARPANILSALELCTRHLIPHVDPANGILDDKPEVEESAARKDFPLALSRHSSGTIQVLALLSAAKLVREQKGHAIVAVEEPETSLEPHMQRWLVGAVLGKSFIDKSQVIVTTHSPAVLRAAGDLTCVNIIHENGQAKRVSKSTDVFVRKRSSVDLYDAFFASKVIIVEGETEAGLYPELCKAFPDSFTQIIVDDSETETSAICNPTGLDKNRVEIVNAHGDNALKIAGALGDIGIELAMMLDGDDEDKIQKATTICRYVYALPEDVALEKALSTELATWDAERIGELFADMFDNGKGIILPHGRLHQALMSVLCVHAYSIKSGKPKATNRSKFLEPFCKRQDSFEERELLSIFKSLKGYIEGRSLACALAERPTEILKCLRTAVAFMVGFSTGSLSLGLYRPDENGNLELQKHGDKQ